MNYPEAEFYENYI